MSGGKSWRLKTTNLIAIISGSSWAVAAWGDIYLAEDPRIGQQVAIKTTHVNATLGDQGVVTMTVNAEGVWAYQFSDLQKQALAQLIAGKSAQEAQLLLSTQAGVAQASIMLSGGRGQTLTSDPAKITIIVQTVSGF